MTFIIRSANDGHIIDTAETDEELESKTWWRTDDYQVVTK